MSKILLMNKALELIYPSNIYCIACGNLIDNTRPYSLCDQCIREIKWATGNTCRICGKILDENSGRDDICFDCHDNSHYFDKAYTCAVYEGKAREIIREFKYKGKAYYGEKICGIMYDRMEDIINSLECDLILPVPMYRKKEQKRGYNQAGLLAKHFAEKTNITCDENILVRIKDTAVMSTLDRADRKVNLQGAIEIKQKKLNEIKMKNILLIDDVYTTGSTADVCAEVLKKGGTKKVYLMTFAAGVNVNIR